MKLECDCELTDELIYKPCKQHWQLMHDMAKIKLLTGADIDLAMSLKLGIPIVTGGPKTWMSPEEYEKLGRS